MCIRCGDHETPPERPYCVHCTFAVRAEVEDGLTKLRLIPKEPEPTLVLAYIWVDAKTSLLGRVLIVDFFGNGNQVSLSNLVLDKKPDAKIFEFTPPAGSQVKDNSRQ